MEKGNGDDDSHGKNGWRWWYDSDDNTSYF